MKTWKPCRGRTRIIRWRRFLPGSISARSRASGKFVCSVCGYLYDPSGHNGMASEGLPDVGKCPRCKQPGEKFNNA